MATVHLPIRQLVEFLLRTGSIDSRFTGFDRALEGAHIHRKLQKAAGDGYQAEVFLSVEAVKDCDEPVAIAVLPDHPTPSNSVPIRPNLCLSLSIIPV